MDPTMSNRKSVLSSPDLSKLNGFHREKEDTDFGHRNPKRRRISSARSDQYVSWAATSLVLCLGFFVAFFLSGQHISVNWNGLNSNWKSLQAQWQNFSNTKSLVTKQEATPRFIGAGTCQLSGTVTDSNCDFASVELVNGKHLLPILSELTATPFFRYFKVNLYCDCPFWPDDGMCSLRDCSVCECDNSEVPQSWLIADGKLKPEECKGPTSLKTEADVDWNVEPTVRKQLQGIKGWRGLNNPWMPEDDQNVEFSYINLLENAERYTGYKGEHPHRIWSLLYSQQCFREKDGRQLCPEKRIFYRLISGIHASISAHVVNEYLLDERGGQWGQNFPEFQERLGHEGVKDRVENLYFAYLFVLRAVVKAGPYLRHVEYTTGFSEEDKRALDLVNQLVDNEALKSACPVPFDEGRLWKSADSKQLKRQLQGSFQNMTKAMDCVGCEKCKLWGKLQLLGLATSLKILFNTESCDGSHLSKTSLDLERNEVIALVNLLERLSKSIEIVRDMSSQIVNKGMKIEYNTRGAVEGLTRHPLQPFL